ncbi:hypothetical protein DFA_06844 [Cavenderia fasciculata]|uniref:ComC supersandwich domain-containing protein n=1 Tax=Cavenderia fasciculata TaxID=261658 RepID=F4Q2F7_CACFS|nr:uncharacterized protein DFA_06844 [Cavenderia fasciculata]EGG18177.1 hypothetical protein DFA_06844 [Cavenderia fasciculata]|eukprot:XP_004366218.1 hypothetical protein DFA_06844 [Cavenderia fasciculata]
MSMNNCTNSMLLVLLVLLLVVVNNSSNNRVEAQLQPTASYNKQNYVSMLMYPFSECSSVQGETPEKVVSFLPGECYVYGTKSAMMVFEATVSKYFYIVYTTTSCTNLESNSTVSFTGCNYNAVVKKYLEFKLGPPQIPPTNTDYLYYEKFPISTLTCSVTSTITSTFARVVVEKNTCLSNDVGGSFKPLSGDSNSIQINNQVDVSCANLSPTSTYSPNCPTVVDGYRVANAFATLGPILSPSIIVTVIHYGTIQISSVYYASVQFASVDTWFTICTIELCQPLNTQIYKTTGVAMIINQIPYTGNLTIYANPFGADYILNATMVSLKSNSFILPSTPIIDSIILNSKTTSSLNISYVVSGGYDPPNANTYVVFGSLGPGRYNYPECQYTTTCIMNDLPVGAIISVSVGVTNRGQSSTNIQPFTLLPPIDIASFKTTPLYNSINVSWVIDPPGYGVTAVLVNVSQTTSSNFTFHSFTDKNITWFEFPVGQNPDNYTFHLTAINDGTTKSTSSTFQWLGSLFVSNTKIMSSLTKSVVFTFTLSGDNGPVLLNFTLNHEILHTGVPYTEGSGYTIGVPSGTTSTVGFIAYDNVGRVSNTVYLNVTTYPVISNISMQVLQAYDLLTVNDPNDWYLLVTTLSSGGVPGDSTYAYSTPIVSQSTSKQGNSITYYMPTFITTIPQPMTITLENDQTTLSLNTEITLYYFPTINSTNSTSDYESIYLTWISDGGMPGNITYQVSVSNPKSSIQVPLVWCLGSNISSCLITGLTSNTEYSVDIKMSSVQFLPINKTILVSTLQYPNNYTCIDRQGMSNKIECNGFGEYLTTLNWTMTNQTNQPTNISPLILLNNWIYSTYSRSKDSTYRAIKITFLQYVQQQEEEEATIKDIPVTFAGQLFYVAVGSIKYTIDIEGWNFNSQLNTLELVTNITQPYNDKCGKEDPINDMVSTNSTEFTSFLIGNDQLVLGKLINRALLDDIPRKVSNRIVSVVLSDSDSSSSSSSESQQQMLYSIITSIPYFNLNAVFDPDLQLLINVDAIDQCLSSPSNSWKIVVGVVVGFAAVVAVSVATIIYKIKMNTRKQYNVRLQERFQEINNNN